jgi:gluconolactonase
MEPTTRIQSRSKKAAGEKPMNLQHTSILMFAAVAVFLSQRAVAQPDSDLVAPGASVTKLADGFEFTEGPAVDAEGNVYFSDLRGNKTFKWTIGEGLSTFQEDSSNANGLFFDTDGNLLACESGNRRITRISMDGGVTVLADSYDGRPLNSPNDIWPDSRGGIYFSDPRFFDQTGVEQDGNHVYYIPPDGGPVMRVVDNLEAPNGVLGTPDGERLYVADHGPNVGRDLTYVYDVQPDGSLTNQRLFAGIGSDGMTLDERGNVYLTEDGVKVFSPDGQQIAAIPVPELPSNVVFGGPDRSTLFITARTGFYAIEMAVRGQ